MLGFTRAKFKGYYPTKTFILLSYIIVNSIKLKHQIISGYFSNSLFIAVVILINILYYKDFIEQICIILYIGWNLVYFNSFYKHKMKPYILVNDLNNLYPNSPAKIGPQMVSTRK